MSFLPPEITAALAQLLDGLSSADNNARSLAEEQLNNEWVTQRPDVLLMGLVEQMRNAQEPSVRAARLSQGALTNLGTYADTVICSCTIPPHGDQGTENIW